MVQYRGIGKRPRFDLLRERQAFKELAGRTTGVNILKHESKQPIPKAEKRSTESQRPEPKAGPRKEPEPPKAPKEEPKVEVKEVPKEEPKVEKTPQAVLNILQKIRAQKANQESQPQSVPEPVPEVVKEEPRKDEEKMKVAIKYGFVGVGQGGNRLAETFSKLKYKACALNTSQQDLERIEVTNKLCFGEGGAGKNIEKGRRQAEENASQIANTIRVAFSEDTDYVIICIGASGGTGAGAWPVVLQALEDGGFKNKIGVIATLPRTTEDTQAKKNCLQTVEALFKESLAKRISPLIIADNSRIQKKYGPDMPITEFWVRANQDITSVFHLINLMAVQTPEYDGTLDAQDYKEIIRSGGCMIYGESDIDVSSRQALANSVTDQTSNGLLADGFNLTDSNCAGVIFIGGKDSLGKFKADDQQYALQLVRQIIGAGTVYNGTYEIPKTEGIKMLSVYGGLGLPVKRIKDLIRETKEQVDQVKNKEINKTSVADIMSQLDSEE